MTELRPRISWISRPTWSEGLLAQLCRLTREHDIDVTICESAAYRTETHSFAIGGGWFDRRELEAFFEILLTELALYPPTALTRVGVRRIVVCQRLYSNGFRLAGSADCPGGVAYFSIGCLADYPSFARKTIHHEFFHILSSCSLRIRSERYSQREALNAPGFKYGLRLSCWRRFMSIVNCLADVNIGDPISPFTLTNRHRGFLNRYSMTSIQEEMAEFFGIMITNRQYVERRAGSDPIIQGKVSAMLSMTRELSAGLGDDFWSKAANH
jgi:hypothetical protein